MLCLYIRQSWGKKKEEKEQTVKVKSANLIQKDIFIQYKDCI